jgi:hypothetical protein
MQIAKTTPCKVELGLAPSKKREIQLASGHDEKAADLARPPTIFHPALDSAFSPLGCPGMTAQQKSAAESLPPRRNFLNSLVQG